jgi:hypothetical protein
MVTGNISAGEVWVIILRYLETKSNSEPRTESQFSQQNMHGDKKKNCTFWFGGQQHSQSTENEEK